MCAGMPRLVFAGGRLGLCIVGGSVTRCCCLCASHDETTIKQEAAEKDWSILLFHKPLNFGGLYRTFQIRRVIVEGRKRVAKCLWLLTSRDRPPGFSKCGAPATQAQGLTSDDTPGQGQGAPHFRPDKEPETNFPGQYMQCR